MKKVLSILSIVILGSAVGVSRGEEKPKFEDAAVAEKELRVEESTNGKSIREMRDKVRELWPEIVFEKDGKPVEYVATLETDEGPVVIEFYPQEAPNHARNFIALAKAGFYDGLIFHRCIPGFMIQGGCPLGRGTGGPGYNLKAEFNGKPHKRGVLSMARSADPDSAGSQFFICVAPANFLDRQYSAFGEVKSGMEAVDKIVARPTGREDRPRNPVKINSVKIAIKGEEPGQ